MSIYEEFSYFTGSGSWAEERPPRPSPLTHVTGIAQRYAYGQYQEIRRDPFLYAYKKGKQYKGAATAAGVASYLFTPKEAHDDKGTKYSKAEVVSNLNETRLAMRNESNATKSEL